MGTTGEVGYCVSLSCSLPGRPAQRPEPSTTEPEPHAPERAQAGADGPPSPEASRSPARGAYLQSLEPSSRRWVLSGAKQPEEATLGPGAPGSGEPASEIWYNPIPEEDPRPLAPEPPEPQPSLAEPEGPALQGEHKPHPPPPPPHRVFQDDHRLQPHPKSRFLNTEVCCLHRCGPCQPPNQSLTHQVPGPCQAPLHENEEAAGATAPPEPAGHPGWP